MFKNNEVGFENYMHNKVFLKKKRSVAELKKRRKNANISQVKLKNH